jgi:DNA-binding response OmpR family regulator
MKKVLVIDDDEQIREMIRVILEDSGYAVYLTSDGDEVTNIYKDNPVDLIITDIIMPERDGLEIINQFRKEHPNVKIIAISGGGKIKAENYLVAAENLGAVKTLSKPFDIMELVDIVKSLIG